MKEKIKSPNKDFEPNTAANASEIAAHHSAEEIYMLNSYWLAYPYPFIPMIDLIAVFDELRKMVKAGS